MARATRLQDDLYQSAERFARSALRAFLDDDPGLFVLHAAVAIEHLSKAYLVTQDASLIVEARDFDSLLHVVGLGAHARRPPALMRTVSLREALRRASQLVPELRNLPTDLELLVEVRDGVIHAGQIPLGIANEVLVPFLRASETLCVPLGIERGQFWADLAEVVDARLSESAEETDVRAAEAIASARSDFESRFGAMAEDVRRAVLTTIERGYSPAGLNEDLVDCPACGTPALASGTYDVDWDVDVDRDDFGEPYIVGATPTVTFLPGHLECRACGLKLDGLDELRSAGIADSWELEDVDADELRQELRHEWEDFEP